MAGLKLVCIAVVCMVLASAAVSEAITCGQVTSYLVPCISFVTGGVNKPTSQCCSGIGNLNAAASTTADRQQVCRCLKNFASSIKSIDYKKVASLPGKCGVSIPYQLSPSTDCSKVR